MGYGKTVNSKSGWNNIQSNWGLGQTEEPNLIQKQNPAWIKVHIYKYNSTHGTFFVCGALSYYKHIYDEKLIQTVKLWIHPIREMERIKKS